MSVDGEDDETVMYTLGDGGIGSSTSSNPLPAALNNIEKIAKKIFKGQRANSCFFVEAGRVESNMELVHLLNQLVQYNSLLCWQN